jgi:hypothetical protein
MLVLGWFVRPDDSFMNMKMKENSKKRLIIRLAKSRLRGEEFRYSE